MDVTGNMNPFLFDDPAPPPTGEESEVGNPFLNGGAFDFSASSYSGVNPFSDQIDETSASAVNIFGDQTTYAPEKNPFECVPETPSLFNPNNEQVVADVDFFGSAPAQEDAPVDIFGAPAPQPPKPPPPRPPSPSKMAGGPDTNNFAKPPPPRPPPPSKETKDLLQTVIGAMEATTDTLQYKLNTTVTPCPSPSGGQHSSRSPTPDIQITAPEKEPDAFSTIFGQTIELSDQECDETASKPKVPEDASEPVQPAVSSESAPSATAASTEEFDLFGEVLPQSKPKTTQDILSLFNKPATTSSPQQVDLLSDDLISASDVPEGQEKEEISDSSAFDLLSSGQETAPDICANKDVSSLDDSSAFPELAATEVDAHPSEVVVSPDTTSEKTISEPDISEVAPQKQQEQIQPHPPDEVEPKPELPKSESEPLELGAAQTEQENKDLSADVKASDESWNITEASKPESEVIPLESLATEQIAPEEIFGVPTTIPEQIINQEPPQETVSEVSPPAINDAFVAVEPPIAPIDTKTLENVFGNTAEPEPLSPSPFFNIPENIAPHPTPSSATSTGFDLFGEVEVGPSSPQAVVTSVAETTGATLFETETPAPNVGMSLFGAGEEASLDIFAESAGNTMINPFAPTTTAPASVATLASVTEKKINEATDEEFDAFSARFENVSTVDTIEPAFDPFTAGQRAASPWGEGSTGAPAESFGFGDDAKFDPFLALNEPPPPPQSTPRKIKRDDSRDSDETPMNVIIRPAAMEDGTPVPLAPSPVPVLAPPPAVVSSAFTDSTPRFNPFDKSGEDLAEAVQGVTAFPGQQGELQRSESQETPPTPLFEEDQSVPLEPFPRTIYDGRTWEMHLRQPNKKKITGQRFWKKVFVKLTNAGALQLYNTQDDKEPFQELPLQPCYSVSDIGAQQFDQFGKIFTVKIQYIFYKERPGVRPGQISKAERITNKLSKFAQYAIAGDYEGVKEFASDVRKLGMPVEHAPQISQLLKLGTQTYEDLKLFASLIEEFMFKLTVHRDRALTYKSEEVQLTAVDEMYVEQDLRGAVTHMVARVRIFFLGFLTGMPEVDLGINDLRKQGHEVVGRHDIIPVITEEWIRLEDIEFHCTVNQEEFESTRHIKFKPPDACYIELMRFRVRPPKNRELPLQVKTKFIILGKRVEIQCEILVPGFSGRKLGQVPCEDVALRFPLPECWIYMFRVEKHFRYGSVKSAHRRTGKVKGIERLKGTVEAPDATLMEVTSGQAKYEHQHRAIVWRMSRLPKEGQGAYSVHQFTCKMNLTDYDQIPSTLDRFCVLEFTMPATTVSHCVMRSVSVTSEEPPEKYVRYLARHEYKIEIEFSSESSQNEYLAATMVKPKAEEKETHQPATLQEESSSDDSS